MSAYNPPTPNPPTPIYNPSEFTVVDTTGITETEADARYIKKSGDTATGLINFANDLTTNSIDVFTGGNLNIGTSVNNDIITIGNPTANVFIYGNITSIDVQNLVVEDSTITVNKNGLTPTGAGLEVESANVIVSSLLNDATGDWVLNSTNDRLYLNELKEYTVGGNINALSNIIVNRGLGPKVVITDRNLESTNGTVINELKTDIAATHGMVGTRTAHNLEIHTNNTPRATFNGTTGALSLNTGVDVDFGQNDISNIASIQPPLNSGVIIGGLTVGSSDTVSFYTSNSNRGGFGTTGVLSLLTTTPSTTSSNGSLVVSGGVGISGNLNVSGNIGFSNIVGLNGNIRTGNIVASSNVIGGNVIANGFISASGRITNDDATNATSSSDGSIQTDGGLSVVKDIVLDGEIKSLTDITDSTSFTTGALQIQQGGAAVKKTLLVGNGISLQTGLGAGPASIGYFDNNRTGGISVPIVSGVMPQCLEFIFSVDMTAGSAATLLTIDHSATTNAERCIYITLEGIIFGSTSSEASLRVQNQNILLVCSNSTTGFIYTNGVRDTVVNNQTASGSLALGTTTYAIGTNTTTQTSITLTQAFSTGTPSQGLAYRGIARIYAYQSSPTTGVSNFITGITIG
jgi:hypothetical protein